MKKNLPLVLAVTLFWTQAFAQNTFPQLNTLALVNSNFEVDKINKPYTVVVYGGVGCGFSKYLIENLGVLADCKEKCDIVLIMDQAKDSITKHMANALDKYPTFTNLVLQYQLKKKPDVFPQLLLFKNKTQINHVVGIKEGMLTNTKKLILEDK